MGYIPKWLVSLSVCTNSFLGGEVGYSLCATFYKWKLNRRIRGRVLVFVSDKLFFWDKMHCRKAYYLRSKGKNHVTSI